MKILIQLIIYKHIYTSAVDTIGMDEMTLQVNGKRMFISIINVTIYKRWGSCLNILSTKCIDKVKIIYR